MPYLPLALLLLAPLPERPVARFVPTADEAAVPAQFRLEESEFAYELEPLRSMDRAEVSTLRFPSPVESPDPVNNTVHAEYFRSNVPGKRPAVVVLHILGADFALARFYAARLAAHGVHAVFLKLPYYGERRPPGSDRRMVSLDIERTTGAMRQGVCDVRRAIAWLGSREEVDEKRLGVTGISLGGIVSSLVAAVDPRVERTALLLAGGDLPTILWNAPEAEAKKAKERWIAAGMTLEKLRELTAPYDPLTHAARLKGKRVLMQCGKVDEVIPPSCAIALWEAAGRPAITWFDCGHYSAVGYLLPAIHEACEFLAAD